MKSSFAAALLVAATALPAFAFDPAAMTDAEKQAFGDAVREYLMANPEVLVESINVLESRRLAQQAGDDKLLVQNNQAEIFEDGHSWVGGNPDGDLTVVEFLDYRCGYCRNINPEVEALLKNDPNIRFIFKEFPILGPESEMASRFAVSVQQIAGADSYKQAHDALMSLRGPVTLASLTKVAEELDLDAKAVLDRMNTEDVSSVLRKNRQLAERMGIQATPTFIIGPQLMREGVAAGTLAPSVAEMRKAVAG